MTDKKLVLTTAGSLEEARKIARSLVDRQLAACVNILPKIESVYRWEGEIETSSEFLLLIKTTSAAAKRVQEAVIELHSYELPECISVAIDSGSRPYLQWLAESVD